MLTVGDDHAVGEGLDAADALEAAAGGHGILQDGVQGDLLQGAVGVLLHGLVDILVAAHALVDAAGLGDHLAGTVGIQLIGALASSQLTAPQSPRRSGVTMQTWLGEKAWQRMQV